MRKAKFLLSAVLSAAIFQSSASSGAWAQATAGTAAADAPAQASDPNRPVRDKWALVIGITHFANSNVPELKYATKDAADFYNYLTKEANFAPDHVRLLLNEKATERRIISEMGTKFLARMAKKDDMVVVFVSTHGSPAQMDIRGENYLVAYDSDPQDLYSSGVEMQKLLGELDKRVLCDRVVLVLDACHSGGVDPNAKGISRVGNFDADKLAEGSGQMVICSSSPDQQSWESRRYPNGVFTHNLLDSLRKSPDKPLVSAFDTARSNIENEVQEDHPNARQTPVMHSKWNGNDLLLAIKPTDPETVPSTVMSDLDPDSVGIGTGSDAKCAAASNPNLGYVLNKPGAVPDKPEPEQSFVLNKAFLWDLDHKGQPFDTATADDMLQSAYEMIGANNNDPQYQFNAAQLEIQMDKLGGPRERVKNILRDQPNNWKAFLCQAYIFNALNMRGQALNSLQQAYYYNALLPKGITLEKQTGRKDLE